jgi:hypothetical protein
MLRQDPSLLQQELSLSDPPAINPCLDVATYTRAMKVLDEVATAKTYLAVVATAGTLAG